MGVEEADAYTPFFARLALLNAENKAMAVHLGRLPQSRRRPEEAAVPLSVKMPKGDPVAMRAAAHGHAPPEIGPRRSEEHTSELQSLMRTSYAVFCIKKKKTWIQ